MKNKITVKEKNEFIEAYSHWYYTYGPGKEFQTLDEGGGGSPPPPPPPPPGGEPIKPPPL